MLKGSDKKFKWNELTSVEEVDELVLASNAKPQVIYKHSNRCAVSYLSRINLEKISPDIMKLVDLYRVDVIRDRPISKYISEKLKVRHESPQLIILKDGEVLWHGSHYQVNLDKMVSALSLTK